MLSSSLSGNVNFQYGQVMSVMPFPVKISWEIWEWQRIWSKFMIQKQWTSSDLGKWSDTVDWWLSNLWPPYESNGCTRFYVNVYNLVLDSHYQPSTSERDVTHTVLFKAPTHKVDETISQGMQFLIRTKVVSRFLDFEKSSTYGFGKQSTDCMFKTN